MKTVWIRHPDLDDRDPIQVPESSLRFHTNAGWELVPDNGGSPGEGGGAQQPTEDTRETSTRKRATKSAENDKEKD